MSHDRSEPKDVSPRRWPVFAADIWPALASLPSNRTFCDVLKECPQIRIHLEPFDPIKSTVLVAGLLTEPALHANTVRLEALVHFLLAVGSGSRRPGTRNIDTWLNADLGACSLASMEDPVEDVFISNVIISERNIRVFEGTWESSDFYLQRILKVVGTLPSNAETTQLKNEIHAVLRLSEAIAERRHLGRFSMGGGKPKTKVSIPSLNQLESLSHSIYFSSEDLQRMGISPAHLSPFVFQMSTRQTLLGQNMYNSDLGRRPIIYKAGQWIILLPGAISTAVRYHVLAWMCEHGLKDAFDSHFLKEYAAFLGQFPLFGSHHLRQSPLSPASIGSKSLLEYILEIDTGRYLQVFAMVDKIGDFLLSGFGEPDEDTLEVSYAMSERMNIACSEIRERPGFKQGMTLIIGCGYGRITAFIGEEKCRDWPIEFLAAPDLQILAMIPNAPSTMLWQLVEHKEFLAAHGISLLNPNGLLNLYQWSLDTNHLMITDDLEFGISSAPIMIPTDGIAKIRKKVRQETDVHALPLPTGQVVRVIRRSARSFFEDQRRKPLYVCIDALRAGILLSVWVGRRAKWWVRTYLKRTVLERSTVFRLWEALSNWLEWIGPVLERHIDKLPKGALLIELGLENLRKNQVEPVPEDLLPSCVSVSIGPETRTVRIDLSDPFLGGFRDPKNIAERALVRAVVTGVFQIAQESPSEGGIEAIVKEIVSDSDSRFVHMLEAKEFRDYIRHFDDPPKLLLDDASSARRILGLAKLATTSRSYDYLASAIASTSFLNSVIDGIGKRMLATLASLNRVELVEKALRYIEGIENDQEQWGRTLRALLSLREDKADTKSVALNHSAQCITSKIALRIVIEMGISTCPIDAGASVGALDLIPLMADAALIFHLGGWSDAIHKGVMDPQIRIAPSGDIMTDTGFRDGIATPLAQSFESSRLDGEAIAYERLYHPIESVPSLEDVVPRTFVSAFEDEFRVSLDVLRRVRGILEDYAIKKRRCVYVARRDEILAYSEEQEPSITDAVGNVLDCFCLYPRSTWDQIPEGYAKKDCYPWRFGRRLSLLAKPIVRLENTENPRYAISPGILGDGILNTLFRYQEGIVDSCECRSQVMASWIDTERNRRSHEFVAQVATVLRGFGYEVRQELLVSELLNEKLERNFGDIDVMAWSSLKNSVLLVECKDIRFAKTASEMGEQFNRFRGLPLPNGKPDDLLKHIERCDLLRAKSQKIAKYTGLAESGLRIRNVVCFSRRAPMLYIGSRFPEVEFTTLDELRSRFTASMSLSQARKSNETYTRKARCKSRNKKTWGKYGMSE